MSSFKEEKIQKLLFSMRIEEISVEELEQFIEENQDEYAPLIGKKLAFRVAYNDGTIGSYLKNNVKIVGVVVDNFVISIEQHRDRLDWSAAVEACKRKKAGSFSWILPSLKQMEAVYQKRDEINQFLRSLGYSSLPTGRTWTSTENSGKAMIIDFADYERAGMHKSEEIRVQAVFMLA